MREFSDRFLRMFWLSEIFRDTDFSYTEHAENTDEHRQVSIQNLFPCVSVNSVYSMSMF